MHVLLTRPEGDVAALKTRIEALGCSVSVAPLLQIAFRPIAPDALSDATSVIATSRNALKALAQSDALSAALALPLFAVGPATAQLAKDLGFSTVIAGPGTGTDLVPVIAGYSGSKSGRLVHVTGDHLAFDLADALRPHGIALRTLPAYASVAAETLPGKTTVALAARTIDAVVLMSPRTAATWARLTASLPDKPSLTDVTHICLSAAVADAISGMPDVKTVIAEKPNADAIISAVYRLAGTAKTG